MDYQQYIKYLEADIAEKSKTITVLLDDIHKLEGQVETEKHKQHKVYTKDCEICDDISSGCGYATKEGYSDFSDADMDNPKDWKEMEDYYNKSS
jgi:cytochrome c